MSLLTDDEIDCLAFDAGGLPNSHIEFARAIEAAILAKLASAELPPVPDLSEEEKQFIHYNPNTGDLVDFIQGHAAAYGRQAYAQGAASQLSAEPVGHFGFVEAWQPMDKWKESNPRLRVIGPLYDKQALIDLLEEAAKECEKLPDTTVEWIYPKNIRKLKETL